MAHRSTSGHLRVRSVFLGLAKLRKRGQREEFDRKDPVQAIMGFPPSMTSSISYPDGVMDASMEVDSTSSSKPLEINFLRPTIHPPLKIDTKTEHSTTRPYKPYIFELFTEVFPLFSLFMRKWSLLVGKSFSGCSLPIDLMPLHPSDLGVCHPTTTWHPFPRHRRKLCWSWPVFLWPIVPVGAGLAWAGPPEWAPLFTAWPFLSFTRIFLF